MYNVYHCTHLVRVDFNAVANLFYKHNFREDKFFFLVVDPGGGVGVGIMPPETLRYKNTFISMIKQK